MRIPEPCDSYEVCRRCGVHVEESEANPTGALLLADVADDEDDVVAVSFSPDRRTVILEASLASGDTRPLVARLSAFFAFLAAHPVLLGVAHESPLVFHPASSPLRRAG